MDFGRSLGNTPECNEVLTILHNVGSRTSICCLTNHVGMGSRAQYLLGHFLMISRSSSLVTSLNSDNLHATGDDFKYDLTAAAAAAAKNHTINLITYLIHLPNKESAKIIYKVLRTVSVRDSFVSFI